MSVDSMEESPEGDTEPFDRPTVPSPAYRGVEGSIEGCRCAAECCSVSQRHPARLGCGS